MGQVDVQH